MPSSEPMLHAVYEVVVSSSLKGLLEYHQVLVAEPGSLIQVYKKLGPHTYHLPSLDERIEKIHVNDQDVKHCFQ